MIRSSASLGALYIVYWLFLRNDTFFSINRSYLLLSAVFSMFIPLISIRLNPSDMIAPVMIFLDPVIITSEKIVTIAQRHLTWMESIRIIYLTGVVIFFIRFIVQLIQLWRIMHQYGITQHRGMKLVFVDRGISPFSFFNIIFIKKELSEDKQLEAILSHEQVHVRQLHTLDLLIAEFMTILLWFNPFAWLLQRSLKTIHEYLADEGTLKNGINKTEYQQLVFGQTLGKQVNNLTNNFNASLLKNRITMMTKSPSTMLARMKVTIAFPAVFIALFCFPAASLEKLPAQDKSTGQALQVSGEEPVLSAQKDTPQDTAFKKPDVLPKFPGGQEAMYKFLQENIKYPEKAKQAKTSGTVFSTFIVEKDGSVSGIKLLRGIGNGCDEEAIRVIQMMPRWEPGMNDSKAVRTVYALPIKFVLAK
jgi:TonB family protein